MRNLLCLTLGLLILFSQAGLQAQALTPDQEARIQQLEKVIQQQEQRIQDLQQKVGAVEQQSRDYTDQVVEEYLNHPDAEEAKPLAGYEKKGFFVRTPDGNMELFLSGYMQWGLALFENHTYDNNSFYPNGICLTLDFYFLENWHGRFQMNFTNSYAANRFGDCAADNMFPIGGAFFEGTALRDAYIEYTCCPADPVFNARIGQFHVPFSMTGQYAEPDFMTIWPDPYILGWAHGRDPGAMVWGVISDMFEYKLGMFNGDGRGRLNNTDDFMFATSARIYPFKKSENPNTFLHVGFIRSRDNAYKTTGVNSAYLTTPWGREVYGLMYDEDYNQVGPASYTQGWKTGVDTGMRLDMYLDEEKKQMRIWTELEFMYMMFERSYDVRPDWAVYGFPADVGDRLPYLHGYGISWGILFQYNLTDVEGAGIYPLFRFSYTDIDNKASGSRHEDDYIGWRDPINMYNVPGQRIWTYTFGLGYAFNKFIRVAFNWVMVDLDEKDIYAKVPAKMHNPTYKRGEVSDDIEHGWFLQATLQF